MVLLSISQEWPGTFFSQSGNIVHCCPFNRDWVMVQPSNQSQNFKWHPIRVFPQPCALLPHNSAGLVQPVLLKMKWEKGREGPKTEGRQSTILLYLSLLLPKKDKSCLPPFLLCFVVGRSMQITLFPPPFFTALSSPSLSLSLSPFAVYLYMCICFMCMNTYVDTCRSLAD